MAGTKQGGIAARETNKKKYGKDYYAKIGSKGGKVANPNKGFGTDNRTRLEKLMRKPKLASVAGTKGGQISRRTKVTA